MIRCYKCKKPVKKIWAHIGGHVYGPDCAQKIIGSDIKSAKYVRWHTLPDDDTMSLFDFAEDDSSEDTPGRSKVVQRTDVKDSGDLSR